MRKLIQSILCGVALASTFALATPASAAPELAGTININTATAAELDLLPGVGPSIAAKVLAYRESRSFGDITHLLRVKGIGRKTFKKLKPFLTIDGETTLRAAGEAKPTSSGDSSQTDDADDIDDAASES
ncbi:MAG: helix-hairpin-helix domain-containing protein [Myxococcales bacterium]|nr:helix-hairpin-helix domain-containing protein [Myxococcales bacterium]